MTKPKRTIGASIRESLPPESWQPKPGDYGWGVDPKTGKWREGGPGRHGMIRREWLWLFLPLAILVFALGMVAGEKQVEPTLLAVTAKLASANQTMETCRQQLTDVKNAIEAVKAINDEKALGSR